MNYSWMIKYKVPSPPKKKKHKQNKTKQNKQKLDQGYRTKFVPVQRFVSCNKVKGIFQRIFIIGLWVKHKSITLHTNLEIYFSSKH